MKPKVLFSFCLLVECSCIFAMQPNLSRIVCGDSYASVKNGECCSVHTIVLRDSALNLVDTINGFALYWIYFDTLSYCDTCELKVDSIIALDCINRSSIDLTEIQQKMIMDRGLKQIQTLHFWFYQYIPADTPLRQQVALKFEISYGKNEEEVTTTVPLGNTLPVGTTANYYATHDIFHHNCVYHTPTATSKDYAVEFVHNAEGYIRYLAGEEHYHFYYIKDHLGNVRETYVRPSANYKQCIQRMQYYPSGLPWNTNYVANEQPYKYNGKEFVEMHGLDEYDSHARWYYPALARTTTMDPHSEDYYPISPYAWCGNNFVNATDPNGMDWYSNDSTQNYMWFKGSNEIEGYVHIGGAGSVLGEFEPLIDRLLTNVYHTDGLYKDGRSFAISSIDKGALIGSKGISGTFFDEFVFNDGPEVSILLSNHPYTRQMMDDPFVKSSQYSMRNGNVTHFSNTRVWTPFSVLNPQNWKMAPQFIGSYRYDIYASSNTSLLNNIVSDSKSLRSLFYHIVPEKYNRSREQSHHFGNTYQFYIW